MARWNDIVTEEPGFAERVQALFDAHKHKTIATLRRDGSPRISGTEASFLQGDLWFGSMWGARKARDLQRDPRFALHSASLDPEPGPWPGDAKLSGRVVEVTDPEIIRALNAEEPNDYPGETHLFRADIAEVVLTRVEGDMLVIEFWQEGQGLRRIERR